MVVGLALGIRVVVAGNAVAGHAAVVEHHARPTCGHMAILADVRSCRVIAGLSWNGRVVVAGNACRRRGVVIHPHDRPVTRDVAGFAQV